MKITYKHDISGNTSHNHTIDRAIQVLLTPSAYSSDKRSKLIASYLSELTQMLVDKKLLTVDDLKELLRADFNVEED